MIRNLIALTISCLLLASAGTAQAEAAQLLVLKKDSVMGMKDGAMARIPASELDSVTGPYTSSGIFVEFSHNGTKYRLKASDTNIKNDVKRTCLPGEVKYAQANQQIGATQMGSGESSCASASK
tara:strand:+ start:57 stop:428 length:372 start_codon:yes stop_codon:yes gene_type:complete